MPAEATRALYVRVPAALADRLDAESTRLGLTKREMITALVSDRLQDAGIGFGAALASAPAEPGRPIEPEFPIHPRIPIDPGAPPPRRPPAHGADLLTQRFWIDPDGPADVLSIEEAAELLRVEADAVTEMVEGGEIPARRVGTHWRLSRSALMAWLRHDEERP